jgi:hypothetical protein
MHQRSLAVPIERKRTAAGNNRRKAKGPVIVDEKTVQLLTFAWLSSSLEIEDVTIQPPDVMAARMDLSAIVFVTNYRKSHPYDGHQAS